VHQPLRLGVGGKKGSTCLKEVLVMPVESDEGESDAAAAAVWLDLELGDLAVEQDFDWYRDGEAGTGINEKAWPRHEVINARLQYSRPLQDDWQMCLASSEPDGILILRLDTGPGKGRRCHLTLGTWIELQMILPTGSSLSLADAYPTRRIGGTSLQPPTGQSELQRMVASPSGMLDLIQERLEQLRPSVERSLARRRATEGSDVDDSDTLADIEPPDGGINEFLTQAQKRQGSMWRALVAACEAVAPECLRN